MAHNVRRSFLWRNRVMLTSSALLLLGLHLLSSGLKPDARATKPSIVLMELLRPVQAVESAVFGGTANFFRNYFDLVGIRQENLRLKKELEEAQSQRAGLMELKVENRHLTDLLELKYALGMNAVAADVIGGDATGLSRTLILSEGTTDRLKRNMAVISTAGVVGRLIAVSPDASRVLLINDHNSAVDTFDQRSRARGIIAGVVDDGLVMKYVDRTEDVKAGDVVITSGMDGIFPRGLLVGEVVKVSQEGPGLFLNVQVKPAVDFRKLEQVLVLTQQPPQLALEGRS
jgi:rod shape-determining protein MreC